MTTFFRVFPLFGAALLAYLGLMVIGVDLSASAEPFARFRLMSDAVWDVRSADLLLLVMVLLLYVEIYKATSATHLTILEHVASIGVFIAYLVIFLAVPGAGTTTFLILASMSLLDVAAGLTITIRSATRDVAFHV